MLATLPLPVRRGAGPALAAALLALAAPAPADDAPAAASPPEGLEGELPFLDGPTNRIHLDLAPEDAARPLRMMVGTGVDYSLFSPQAAKEAGVRPRRLKSTPYRRSTVLDRPLLFFIDTRWSDHVTTTGWDAPLLGGNFLEHYVLEIDFPARVVRFWDPEEHPVPESVDAPGETVVPMRLNARRPVIEVEVGGARLPVLVDTATPFGLAISGGQAEEAGLVPVPEVEVEVGGIVGRTTMRLAEAPAFRIGSLELEGVPVFILPHGFYNVGARGGDAILGYDVLAEFVVRIDYEHGRAWLKHAAPGRRLYAYDYGLLRELGVLLDRDPDGQPPVAGLWPDGPAARAGVAVGDVLELEGGEEALAAALRDGGALRVEAAGEGGWIARVAPADAGEGPAAVAAPPSGPEAAPAAGRQEAAPAAGPREDAGGG